MLSIIFRPLVAGKRGGQIVSLSSVYSSVHRSISHFWPFFLPFLFPCLPFTCCPCWEGHLLPLLMLMPHEFRTVASFDMHHLLRFSHLPPIFYRWLFSFSICCRLVPFKHSLTIVKESKEEEEDSHSLSETKHHFNEHTIFYFVDAPYFICLIIIL